MILYTDVHVATTWYYYTLCNPLTIHIVPNWLFSNDLARNECASHHNISQQEGGGDIGGGNLTHDGSFGSFFCGDIKSLGK
jgi:hypothetical protein